MKIATLTLHLPFNYGNALQMFSLHRYLLEQGYDAEVLSHWYYKNKDEVLLLHHKYMGLRSWLHFALDALMFSGTISQYRREGKLNKWLTDNIRWSRESGPTGEFNPSNLPHDTIIVGSDQVWNPIHASSGFFLLPDFGDRFRKIAYAASMGTDTFVEEKRDLFKKNLERFSAISVRESSATEMLKSLFDIDATLVCDPTLLHTKDEWLGLLNIGKAPKTTKHYVVYLVTPDFKTRWRELIRLARQTNRKIHFFAFQWSQTMPSFSVRHPVKSLSHAARNIMKRLLLFIAGIRLHLSATPPEFVASIARSDGLFTDSFHGMMFATIFEKKCNVVIGAHKERQQMSARLRNFTKDYGNPEILTPTFDPAAMQRLGITPKLQELIGHSKLWLKQAIED